MATILNALDNFQYDLSPEGIRRDDEELANWANELYQKTVADPMHWHNEDTSDFCFMFMKLDLWPEDYTSHKGLILLKWYHGRAAREADTEEIRDFHSGAVDQVERLLEKMDEDFDKEELRVKRAAERAAEKAERKAEMEAKMEASRVKRAKRKAMLEKLEADDGTYKGTTGKPRRRQNRPSVP